MKTLTKLILGITLVVALITTKVVAVAAPVVIHTETPVIEVKDQPVVIKTTRKALSDVELNALIEKYATKYTVSAATMRAIIKCENEGLVLNKQSGHYYKEGNRWGFSTTTQEKSFGIVQIHLPDHNVTYEQAIDADFSVDFLAKNISLGRASWWTCYTR